ncbi:MAG TPA: MEMO1 family protein [Nitrosopumilaceae archaeon]|nr:MEMO1 family protein [Nitrosopumilaceae archaeon]
MQIRTPAVAGMFYPGETNELRKSIKESFLHSFGPGKLPPVESSEKIFGVICPHAGYIYSGPIACNSIYSISALPADLYIIIGPNHWGIGCSVATMKDCLWETPIGSVEVDTEAAEEISKFTKIIELDFFSHTKEHSLEVQVPILQETFSNNFKILPIALVNQNQDVAIEVGNAMAKIAQKKNTMIIGSSDFTHYEPNDFAHKQDEALIEQILKMDIDGFYDVLHKRQVTACGYGAIAATMIASKELGATKGKLLRYATSGDITGDKSSVVGYGSIIFT